MKKMISILPNVVVPAGLSGWKRARAEVFMQEIALRTGIALRTAPTLMPGVENVVILTEERFRRLCRSARKRSQGWKRRVRKDSGCSSSWSTANSFPVRRRRRRKGRPLRHGQTAAPPQAGKGAIAADMDFAGLSSTPATACAGISWLPGQAELPPLLESGQFDRYIRELMCSAATASNCFRPARRQPVFRRCRSTRST